MCETENRGRKNRVKGMMQPVSNKIRLVILTTLIGGGLMIASGPAAESFDLGAYQWKNRLFLLFASSDADPEYRSFTKALEK